MLDCRLLTWKKAVKDKEEKIKWGECFFKKIIIKLPNKKKAK